MIMDIVLGLLVLFGIWDCLDTWGVLADKYETGTPTEVEGVTPIELEGVEDDRGDACGNSSGTGDGSDLDNGGERTMICNVPRGSGKSNRILAESLQRANEVREVNDKEFMEDLRTMDMFLAKGGSIEGFQPAIEEGEDDAN